MINFTTQIIKATDYFCAILGVPADELSQAVREKTNPIDCEVAHASCETWLGSLTQPVGGWLWHYGGVTLVCTKFIPATYGARCRVPKDLVAQEYSFINIGCVLDVQVELGLACFAPHAVLLVETYPRHTGRANHFTGRLASQLHCGADAWIGFGVIILAGVSIGRGAIVGAGSLSPDVPHL
ncbi:MAG: hypothetical protein R3B37_11320 [Nitrospira sp.]|nr:hypothetical protein [Nitrospira sp.]